MSTRSFWKVQSGSKDKTGTASDTPSTSGADASDANINIDVSSSSLRNVSEEKSAVLTAAAVETVTLWKQPSKKRLFGVGSNPQKRYFVLTAKELAYKEKDNGDNEFKVVWKIPSEVTKVEAPEAGSKEFGVIVLENGVPRSVKLLAADPMAAAKFASAVSAAIKAATISKTSADGAAGLDVSAVASVGATELTLEDANETSVLSASPSATTKGLEESTIMSADVPSELPSLVEDAPVPIAAEGDQARSEDQAKPAVWSFWGMCCSAE